VAKKDVPRNDLRFLDQKPQILDRSLWNLSNGFALVDKNLKIVSNYRTAMVVHASKNVRDYHAK